VVVVGDRSMCAFVVRCVQRPRRHVVVEVVAPDVEVVEVPSASLLAPALAGGRTMGVASPPMVREREATRRAPYTVRDRRLAMEAQVCHLRADFALRRQLAGENTIGKWSIERMAGV
jgi:hypothetical protein